MSKNISMIVGSSREYLSQRPEINSTAEESDNVIVEGRRNTTSRKHFSSLHEVKLQMMDLRVVLTLISLSSFLYTFQTQESKTPDVTDLSFRNMDFAMNLYRRISRHHDNNVIFSPLSVSVSLATLLLAAGGSTRAQIAGGLNLASLDDDDDDDEIIPQLFQDLLSNISLIQQNTALFVDNRFDLEQLFSHQVKRFFGADVIAVEFGKTDVCRDVINDYISKKTACKVREMVKSVEPLTQMMLINTIFFKGDWQRPFDPNSTEASRFYVDKYNIVQVPLMFAEDKFFTTVDNDVGARVLQLPYRGGASLLIVLPDPSVDYTAIEDELTADRIFRWIKNLKPVKMEVHVPKFRLEQRYDMRELLPHLGISSVFLDSANLTGLSKDVGVKVSQVMHTAVMDVDEKGTTAASVTLAGITTYSLPATFRVDRPFFFFLYHEASHSLLFMGRVIDPTKNSQ